MRSVSGIALTVLLFSLGTAQAGQVYINDTRDDGITVTDNCSGACFGNFISVDNEHVTFDWYVSLPSTSTQTVFAAMIDPGDITSDLIVLNAVLGSSTVGVSFYSDGGAYDIDAMGLALYGSLGAPGYLGPVFENGDLQKVADYLNFSIGPPHPSVDQLFVASGTPEPGTWLLGCTGFAGLALYRRRRKG